MDHSERSVSVGEHVFGKSSDDNIANLCNWFNTLDLPGKGSDVRSDGTRVGV